MTTLLTFVAALALAAIPLAVGWRRGAGEAGMARALGVAPLRRSFDPERFARQTGTGLAFNQLLLGCLAWTVGGFLAGLALGPLAAVLFAVAGGLFYAGGLFGRRQEFRLRQAKDILRALGMLETLLQQGRPLQQAIEDVARAVGVDGRMVLEDLARHLRSAPADQTPQAVREWSGAWDNPAVDVVGTVLLASLEGRIDMAPLVAALRGTLSDIVEILSRARAAARGIEWQARFLALFPPAVAVIITLIIPSMGSVYAANPVFLLPVLLGSGLSYLLSMRMIQDGLSIEASMGLLSRGQGEIRLDRLGRVL
jgi:Flp pilus assembly protein TadB